jgi:cytochrome c peroxidase
MGRLFPPLFVLVLTLLGCSESRPKWTPEELRVLGSLSPVGAPPPSPGNAHADDERAAELGWRIFFDTGFSRDGRLACATCHDPMRGFTDGTPVAFGLHRGSRNTPTLLGAPWFTFYGWDGHSDSLWSQSLRALLDPAEHGMQPHEVAARVESHYREPYEIAFGPHPGRSPAADERVFVNVGKALEAYVRRLAPGPAPFDAYVADLLAGDPNGGGHLSASGLRGLQAFVREGCVSCHNGPLFTDGEFHNLGLPPSIGVSDLHLGRTHGARRVKTSRYRCGSRFSDATSCDALRFTNPEFEDFVGAFKTPTLRNVEHTAPYMHSGQLATLEDVIEHYRTLPGSPRVGRRDPQLCPLGRAIEPHAMIAFLRALSEDEPGGDSRWRASPPREGTIASAQAKSR